MFPVVMLWKLPVASDYFTRLEEELVGLQAGRSESAPPSERWRVYWDGMPM